MSWFKKLVGDGEVDGPKKEQLKRIKIMVVGAALGIGLLFLGGLGDEKKAQAPPVKEKVEVITKENESIKNIMASEEEYLSGKLCQMLEQIDGAGKVKVTIRLENSTRTEYAINTSTGKKTTQEKDQTGGTRTLTEDTDTGQLVLVTRNGEETPVMSREIAPTVAGVLVVADGANDPRVKAQLFRAAQVSLGVEPQKVIVMAKKAGE
ncbi:conserved hypothetical protein [Desulforamulus reducens MI-1]|uniref:Stage III sporulation protein AG n=1 Tax=Desulforamulus reducens (strain ATCC BAA-1160 / DSM 100696 / MI-1) TaxID=349161 RepID=A4J3E4_DESRM|nr:hypothetical protein [Desulforamulus reducens]ABO49597.1 conserved hypothetical protein [Desulforamulus reducens MI-1]